MRAVSAHALIALVLGALGALGACGDDGGTAAADAPQAVDAATDQAVSIAFAGKVNGADFHCGQSYAGVGNPAAAYVPKDFRLFVSAVKLVTAAGPVDVTLDQDAFQLGNIALLDFETGDNGCDDGTAATHVAITGRAPKGPYTGISLVLGLPAEMDHLDASTAQPPLDDVSMWWVWRSGYRYLRIDGSGGAGNNPFSVHLGATGCPGSSSSAAPSGPCAAPNLSQVALSGFDPTTATIAVDLGAVLATSDVTTNTPSTGGGCLSDPDDPECELIFPRLGLAYGAAPAGTQVLFVAP